MNVRNLVLIGGIAIGAFALLSRLRSTSGAASASVAASARTPGAYLPEDPLDPLNFQISPTNIILSSAYGRPGFINEAEWAAHGQNYVRAMMAGYVLVPYRDQAGQGMNVYWEDMRNF